MSVAKDRRGFLRGLVTLPLIGGSMTLIGRPTAVAEPATFEMLETYRTWLHFERRLLTFEMTNRDHDLYARSNPMISLNNPGSSFHDEAWWSDADLASSRAALVLGTVGCDWRGGADA